MKNKLTLVKFLDLLNQCIECDKDVCMRQCQCEPDWMIVFSKTKEGKNKTSFIDFASGKLQQSGIISATMLPTISLNNFLLLLEKCKDLNDDSLLCFSAYTSYSHTQTMEIWNNDIILGTMCLATGSLTHKFR